MTHIIAVVAAAPVVSGVRLTPLQRRAPTKRGLARSRAMRETESARARASSTGALSWRSALGAQASGGLGKTY